MPQNSLSRHQPVRRGDGRFFQFDAELKIWISGNPTPIQAQFNKQLSIYEVQAVLAS